VEFMVSPLFEYRTDRTDWTYDLVAPTVEAYYYPRARIGRNEIRSVDA